MLNEVCSSLLVLHCNDDDFCSQLACLNFSCRSLAKQSLELLLVTYAIVTLQGDNMIENK